MRTVATWLALALSWNNLAHAGSLEAPGLPAWPINNVGQPITTEIAYWRSKAMFCAGKPGQYDQFPTRRHLHGDEFGDHCEDGDMNLFNGMLCAVGEEAACRAVRQAQAPSGQWFRSPRRKVYFAQNCGTPDSHQGATAKRLCLATFSPDMALGTMLYAVKKGDPSALRRWYSWLRSHTLETKVCDAACMCVQLAWPRVCQHDLVGKFDSPGATCRIIGACALRPTDAGDYRVVAQYLGVLSTLNSPLFDYLPAHPETLPLVSSMETLFYAEHLDGVRVLLRMLVVDKDLRITKVPSLKTFARISPKQWGELDPVMLHVAARSLALKNPWNPFFSLLADGPAPGVRAKILAACPKPGASFDGTKWILEQHDDSDSHISAKSSGWDCIFVASLYNRMRIDQNLTRQLLNRVNETLDPLQQTINGLSLQITIAGEGLAAATSLKAEHDRLIRLVNVELPGAIERRKQLEREIGALERSIPTLSDACRRAIADCSGCNRAENYARCAIQCPPARTCRPIVDRIDQIRSRITILREALGRAVEDVARMTAAAQVAQHRLVAIEEQHIIESIEELTAQLAEFRDELQAARDRANYLQRLDGVWRGTGVQLASDGVAQ